MRPLTRLALAPALALALSGCALVGLGTESPEVIVTGITPEPGGNLEQRMRVDLRVRNPNRFDLHVVGIDFQLDVNGTRLARGLGNQEVVVPALGEAVVSVTTSTSLLDLARQVMQVTERRSVEYEIHGRLHLADGWRRSVAFDSSNTLIR